ncbi:ACT domain-containing protein [Chryseobacterium sp. L7]|uniref:ACT domain-containing protein n=1 Tax=Chryseobacterium endalhagicum TaxID=2797638 RepID=A0ABS1QJ14_9FLAO|nr:ACT domain-containing protein [Chryseobacterium endalhagicum]MBL1222267.1 ACT domain-containing protein [Chryseobacterium endalhagicum]
MSGEKDLQKLLKSMKPQHNTGDYVFCTIKNTGDFDLNSIEMFFREEEGGTLILKKEAADQYNLEYSVVMSWITLTVHSSLEAVGLTAAFSKALSDNGISCNVVAAYFHDHIFVNKNDTEKAMEVLNQLSE